MRASIPDAPERRRRYAFVDGIRGLAATSVMLFHLGTTKDLARTLTSRVTALFERGWIGVYVFFVLSGFVIAHSVGRREMTLRRAGRFMLRRQVRLDPPYWCAIAVGVIGPFIAHLARPTVAHWIPSARDVFFQVLYLSDLLGSPAISWVFWSLAIEVQFYLVFVVVLALLRRAPRAMVWLVAASAIASLHGAMTWRFPHAWFVTHWYLFAIGALTKWALDGRVHVALPASFAALFVAAGAHYARLEPTAGGIVAALLLFAGARDKMHRWLSARPLQFLGLTSYGIYLFHTPFAGLVRLALGLLLPTQTAWGALVVFCAQIAVALLLAALLHRTVESWAIRLAARVRWEEDVGPIFRADDGDSAPAMANAAASAGANASRAIVSRDG